MRKIPDGESGRVNWQEIADLEVSIYGKVVSPELINSAYDPDRIVYTPKPLYDPSKYVRKIPENIVQNDYSAGTFQASVTRPKTQTVEHKGHYHRSSDNLMVNPFTMEVSLDQWCKEDVTGQIFKPLPIKEY